MPVHLEEYGRSWETNHPDWAHVLWTEDTIPKLRNQRLFDQADKLVPSDAVGQFRADIVRYELLLAHGGVYLDADLESLKPIDQLIEGLSCFAAWEQEPRWINNAFMGAAPRHPFLKALVEGLPASVRRRRGARPNIMSGPQYVSPIYRRHAKTVTVFPKRFVYPYSWSDLGTAKELGPWPDAYAVHHWHHRRTLRGEISA